MDGYPASDLLFVEHLRDEEVLGKEASEPLEPVQLVKLRLLQQVRHAREAAHPQHVERQVVPRHVRTKVHLASKPPANTYSCEGKWPSIIMAIITINRQRFLRFSATDCHCLRLPQWRMMLLQMALVIYHII